MKLNISLKSLFLLLGLNIIFLFWIINIGFIIKKDLLAPFLATNKAGYEVLVHNYFYYGTRWMGIYFQDRKIGYLNTSIIPKTESAEDGYILNFFARLQLPLWTQEKSCNVRFEGDTFIDSQYALKEFIFRAEAEDIELAVRGTLEDKLLMLDVTLGDTTIKKEVPVREDIVVSDYLTPFLALGNIYVGKEVVLQLFDPWSLSYKNAILRVVDKERMDFRDSLVTVYVLELKENGVSTLAWVSKEGKILKVQTPVGWTLVREPESEAVVMEQKGVYAVTPEAQ